jgi:hypothetical protein
MATTGEDLNPRERITFSALRGINPHNQRVKKSPQFVGTTKKNGISGQKCAPKNGISGQKCTPKNGISGFFLGGILNLL